MSVEEIIDELDGLRFILERKRDRERADTGVFRASSSRLVAINAAIALLRTRQDNQQGELQGNGWRSVDDPPKDGEEVLVYTAWHETMATLKVVYLNGAWWRKPGMQRLPSVPTHWCPLPEPPKEG